MKVKVSQKFQIVLPCQIRESLNIKPGDEMEIFKYENRINVCQ